LIADLLACKAYKVNASAFFMDQDLLLAAKKRGFKNDPNRAITDLLRQLPKLVRDEFFPPKVAFKPATPTPPPALDQQDEDDQDDSGDSGMGNSTGLSMSRSIIEHEQNEERSRGISM
jgi:hypothetical protein